MHKIVILIFMKTRISNKLKTIKGNVLLRFKGLKLRRHDFINF